MGTHRVMKTYVRKRKWDSGQAKNMQVYPKPQKGDKTHSGVKSRKIKSSTVSLQVRNILPLSHHEALDEQQASVSPLGKVELLYLDSGFQKLLENG